MNCAVPTNSSGIAVARRVAEALRDEAADAGARPRVRRAAEAPQVPPIRRLDDGVVQKLRMLDGAGAVARVNEPVVAHDLPEAPVRTGVASDAVAQLEERLVGLSRFSVV